MEMLCNFITLSPIQLYLQVGLTSCYSVSSFPCSCNIVVCCDNCRDFEKLLPREIKINNKTAFDAAASLGISRVLEPAEMVSEYVFCVDSLNISSKHVAHLASILRIFMLQQLISNAWWLKIICTNQNVTQSQSYHISHHLLKILLCHCRVL